MTIDKDKIKRQLELEEESVQLGVQRYREQVKDTPVSEMPPGLALLHRTIEPLAQAIDSFTNTSRRGGARMHQARGFLKRIDPYDAAYITSRMLLNSIASVINIQTIAINLTDTLIAHIEYTRFRKEYPYYVNAIEKRLNRTTRNEKQRRTALLYNKRRMGIPDEDWSNVDKLHVGVKLIELFIETTGLVERVQRPDSVWVLQGTEEAILWIQKQHARCELLSPVFQPMIVKPVPWDSPFGGGFLTNYDSFRLKLVKTRNKEAMELLSKQDMPAVYQAINTVQETPWCINRKLLEVVEDVWRLDNGLAGMPRDEELPLPPTPWSSDDEFQRLKEEQPEVVSGWKTKASHVYTERIRTRSKRFRIAQQIWMADKFKDEEEIYFVWTLDWRGRMYPVQSFLNPQADDLGKALLEFAEGKPLGSRGVYWLAVHLANKYGVDKISFDERVQWVHDHEEEILDSARNPIDGLRFWEEADDPWQFLAGCFEWLGYKTDGESFVSHIPIAMDGSCNGLQNFSAMLLDEVGGVAVNLVPSETPQDVYSEVAAVVSRKLEKAAAEGDEMAQVWVGKVDRNMAKRNVMTVPYGVSLFGMKDQLLEELSKRGPDYLDCDDPFHAAIYLAKLMYESIGEVVIAARQAMDWLQEVASVVSSSGQAITWTTPAGYLVHQQYFKQKNLDIRTFWGATRVKVKLSLNEDTDVLDKHKQRNGISPNFVHSMDASHLMLTVNKLKAHGINSFACIHDSYGTHAADTDTLHELLREAFVEQYKTDVLAIFAEEVKRQLPPELAAEIPPLPEKGQLNLDNVRSSLYFFA